MHAIAPSCPRTAGVFTEPYATRPVVVWPSGPLDVVAAFDKAVDPAAAGRLSARASLTSSQAEPAGDRDPSPRPSGALRIVGARLTDAGRTLTLATDPHPRLARYVLPLPRRSIPRQRSNAGEDQLRPFGCRGRLDPRHRARTLSLCGQAGGRSSISMRRAADSRIKTA